MKPKIIPITGIVVWFIVMIIITVYTQIGATSTTSLPNLPTHTTHFKAGDIFLFAAGNSVPISAYAIQSGVDRSVPDQVTGVYTDYLTLKTTTGLKIFFQLTGGEQFLFTQPGFHYDKKTGDIVK